MRLFKKTSFVDPIEDRFNSMMALIKDLDKTTYNRLKEAMDLGWASYQKVRGVKTVEEKAEEKIIKENEDIATMERVLEKENTK